MTLETFRDSLGNFAKDIKLNLGAVLTEDDTMGLSQRQIYGIALASAYSTKNLNVINALVGVVAGILPEAELNAAKAAATIMAMNNVYYRFVYLASDKEYGKMPARLRMNIIANPGIAKVDFELYSLAVSAINGCGTCIDAHVREIAKAGVSKAAIQAVIRIAAVIYAVAQADVIS